MKVLINVVACGPLGIIKGINDINNQLQPAVMYQKIFKA